jgi:hypothetical protein
MFHSGLTKPERELRNLLRLWVVAFFAAGLCFAAVPTRVAEWLNEAGRWVHWPGPELLPATDHLWHILAISLMVLLVVMCSRAIKELGHSLLLVRLLMLAKVVSGLGYIVALVTSEVCFAYLAGALVDLGIAGLTYFYYRQVVALKGSL